MCPTSEEATGKRFSPTTRVKRRPSNDDSTSAARTQVFREPAGCEGGSCAMLYQNTLVSAATSSRRPDSSSAFSTAKRGGGPLRGLNNNCLAPKYASIVW